jgi:hypothetical protein
LRLGFSYREIEDLRLAVDEAVILLLRHDHPDDTLTLVFDPSPERLIIDLYAPKATQPSAPDDETLDRFMTIVADVVDDYAVDADLHHLRLVKHHRVID